MKPKTVPITSELFKTIIKFYLLYRKHNQHSVYLKCVHRYIYIYEQ